MHLISPLQSKRFPFFPGQEPQIRGDAAFLLQVHSPPLPRLLFQTLELMNFSLMFSSFFHAFPASSCATQASGNGAGPLQIPFFCRLGWVWC